MNTGYEKCAIYAYWLRVSMNLLNKSHFSDCTVDLNEAAGNDVVIFTEEDWRNLHNRLDSQTYSL